MARDTAGPWVAETDFVRAHTESLEIPLLPGLVCHLARDPHDIWQTAELAGWLRPFWAFAWPGGQGLARYMLDNPAVIAGRTVLDVGSGSGLTAVAARIAGARQATAADTDPVACAAALVNAQANGVEVMVSDEDLLGQDVNADVIVIGDLFYEPELATRVTRFLESAVQRGSLILFGDRTTGKRPPLPLELLGHYEATPVPALVEDHTEAARVWRVGSSPR